MILCDSGRGNGGGDHSHSNLQTGLQTAVTASAFFKKKKANKVGVPAQTPQKTGFTIHFAYLKSSIEFQWDTILLFIYNPHTSRCAVRTAAAFQQASDAYSLHVTFYHIAHI